MKNLLTALIFLFISTELYAQEAVKKNDIIIHIRTTSSMSYGSDFINIFKRDSMAAIIYANFDSIAYAAVRKDTAYINLFKNIDLAKIPNYLESLQPGQLKRIFDRHSVTTQQKLWSI